MADSPMICECCWELNRVEVPAPHWMEWGEWLCSSCAASALEVHAPASLQDHREGGQ